MKTDIAAPCPHGPWPARECYDCTPTPVDHAGCPLRGVLTALALGGVAWAGIVLGWRLATRLGGWA